MGCNASNIKVLVYYSHPVVPESKINVQMLEELAYFPSVTLRNLGQLYPDNTYTAEAISSEQAEVAAAHIIVFQFPINSYAVPYAMKDFMENVFKDGWCYGSNFALQGKKFAAVCTTNATSSEYAASSPVPIGVVTDPLYAFAKQCKMTTIEPLVIYAEQAENCKKVYSDYFEMKIE